MVPLHESAPPKGMKVLVIDDSDPVTRTIADYFGDYGLSVLTANTLGEAVKALSSDQRFDAIVTDLVLGPHDRVGGIKVIDEVRRSSSKNAPVIVYTAYPGEFRKDLAELGVTVLSKLDGPDSLLDVINRQVESTRRRNELEAQASLRLEDIRRLVTEEIARLAPIKARTIEVPGQGSFELVKALQGYKREIEEQMARFPYERNVFLMMKFRPGNRDLADFIIETLRKRGFNAVRADDNDWQITSNVYNPIAVIYCCKYGMALFDEPEPGQAYSANVAYELAIMHYQGKECLILKNSSLPAVPFDLIKDLYESYDKDLQVRSLVELWVTRLIRGREA